MDRLVETGSSANDIAMSRPLASLLLLLVACSTAPAPELRRNDAPDRAAAYYSQKRTGSADIHRSYDLARAAMSRMPRYSTAEDRLIDRRIATHTTHPPRPLGQWQFLGPGNVGGRTRVLLIDPDQPNIMYAAGVSGGVWKTTTAGARWEPIGDQMINIAVNSMAMHPADRNILYAGTGEGYFREEQRGTGLPLRGNGIFVTRDAGATWTRLGSTAGEDFHWVNDLVISTHDPSRIYAATRTGVWRSTDAGETWSRIFATAVKGGCLDLAWRGDTEGDFLFASCGTFEQAGVHRTKNGEADAPWETVLAEPDMGRTTLAIAPSNPSIVYALSASNQSGTQHQGLHAVYRSDQNGDAGSWGARVTYESTQKHAAMMLTNARVALASTCNPSAADQFITMGWYCNTISVDPLDPERVWVGGVDLFRSDDGGRTWGVASYWWAGGSQAYVHADQHAIVFHPKYDGKANRTVYFANDGGVFRTDDALAATGHGVDSVCSASHSSMQFVPLNNSFGVTQFYHGAVFPDGRQFIGGTQDNGTIIGSVDAGPDAWLHVLGGDGAFVAVDQTDPRFVYAESQFGNFAYSETGGTAFRRVGRPGDDFAFVTPFVLDPNRQARIWIGGRRLWRSETRGSKWTAASTPLPAQLSAIAVAPGNSNRVIAGTNEGHILGTPQALSATSATAWTVVKPRDGFVSSIAFEPYDPSVVYATYAGFGGAHVWRSLDGGATWTSIDGSGDGALPDIPVHSIAVDPRRRERLYLGTDLGVFVSIDDGRTWAVENTGFAAAVTEWVTIGAGQNGPAIYAFTHGRGAWRAELVKPGPRRRAVR